MIQCIFQCADVLPLWTYWQSLHNSSGLHFCMTYFVFDFWTYRIATTIYPTASLNSGCRQLLLLIVFIMPLVGFAFCPHLFMRWSKSPSSSFSLFCAENLFSLWRFSFVLRGRKICFYMSLLHLTSFFSVCWKSFLSSE
jgi:hypothetical protein